jgi:hypothetical protein
MEESRSGCSNDNQVRGRESRGARLDGHDDNEGGIAGGDVAAAADNDKGGTYMSTTTHKNQIELRREKERGRVEAVAVQAEGLVD